MSTAPFTTRVPDQFPRECIEAPDVHPGLLSIQPRRAVITGAGLHTPLGPDVQQTWRALLEGQYITDHTRAAGEFDTSSPRIIQMARQVASQAMREANWSDTDADDIHTIVGTSKGSIESWLTPLQHMAHSTCVAGGLHPTGLADIANAIAPGAGPRMTLSGACASGLIALIRGAMLIEAGHADRVLVVAAEASVHPLFLASFSRLGILAPCEIGCRPFDENRQGFLMSEAAAAICLEARIVDRGADTLFHPAHTLGKHSSPATQAQSTVAFPTVVIEQYALAADATHLMSPNPDGRVLKHLINKVTQSRPVDLIHAHGTGTPANDPIELTALESVFQITTSAPCLYSHKAALGHSLGAAGLISVVLNLMAHREDRVPPNIRTTSPLRTTMQIHATPHSRPIHRSLTLASGFGGASAAITLVSI